MIFRISINHFNQDVTCNLISWPSWYYYRSILVKGVGPLIYHKMPQEHVISNLEAIPERKSTIDYVDAFKMYGYNQLTN